MSGRVALTSRAFTRRSVGSCSHAGGVSRIRFHGDSSASCEFTALRGAVLAGRTVDSARHCQRRSAATGATHSSPRMRYEDLVSSGEITRDEKQERVVGLLDDLSRRVSQYTPMPRATPVRQQSYAAPAQTGGGGFFSGIFGGSSAAAKPQPARPSQEPRVKPQGPKGLYVYGGCGTGKTFLMDLFYDAVPVEKKKRIHFHEWMIDVHERLHRLQKKNAMVKQKANTVWTAEAAKAQRETLQKGSSPKESADDLVVQVANEMMNEAWLLCFDEFQVTHISDAIIMKRLFSVLFEQGVIVIGTSNRPPEDLYLNGLNRELFMPFIPMLKDFCEVHNINSEIDYRLTTTGEEEDRRVYLHPNGMTEGKLLERKFYRIAHGEVISGGQVETQGRRIAVPKAALNSNVAWFTFPSLCDKPLGAADYLAVASAFHTVFISDIPQLDLTMRDQVRRFITLIDAFYEKHTKLVCTAGNDPINLFYFTEDDKKNSTYDEIFAWDRTASRLIEMQSTKYLSESARIIDGDQFLGQFNLMSLSDDDLFEMWRRYDRDDSGEIDEDELKDMLKDLLEIHKGHRNLSEETFDACMSAVDTDKNGTISYEEFEHYLRDFTLVKSTVQF